MFGYMRRSRGARLPRTAQTDGATRLKLSVLATASNSRLKLASEVPTVAEIKAEPPLLELKRTWYR